LHHLSLLLFFFSLLPRPPSSTLFPYTTLFRSRPRTRTDRRRRPRALRSARRSRPARRGSVPACRLPRPVRRARRTSRTTAARTPDRKSTRLNSSHVKISYAVFCLKKKKKEHKK